ncbi:hypothetical protein MLD38_024975 [Melastoma candidum]|uniref:Uncharacterized protein n=1 Tax=Melastoma candidum TaxID=119954 RepID=A0ACB9NTY2_9MYRT|nr:hypothetical protein MLD38_024975 [Melastoma candidum]
MAEQEQERKRKRTREEEVGEGVGEGVVVEAKELKVGDETLACTTKVGYKEFGTSAEMFDYFCGLLRAWPTNVNLNKYESGMLLDLIKKGHAEPEKKIGAGIKSFVIRYHPVWKSRCFFLVREDQSSDDFSFRKCVDHILPLPDEMKAKAEVNKALGGRNRGGRGGGGGRGRGRGGGGGRGRGRGRR